MTDHDPWCRYPTTPITGPDDIYDCDCWLLAKVRADERAVVLAARAYERAELRAEVEELRTESLIRADMDHGWLEACEAVLDMIDDGAGS